MGILIVDDVPDNISILKAILTKEGYPRLYEATSAKRAFEVLQDVKKMENAQVDLILLDIMMPEMDGIEACRHIKSEPANADIPIIMVTAKTDIESLQDAFKAGAMDYIVKPFRQLELAARVRSAVSLKEQTDARRHHEQELEHKNAELENALAEIKTLREFIPICAVCKDVRNMDGQWEQMEAYLLRHADISFSHGICKKCMKKEYGDLTD